MLSQPYKTSDFFNRQKSMVRQYQVPGTKRFKPCATGRVHKSLPYSWLPEKMELQRNRTKYEAITHEKRYPIPHRREWEVRVPLVVLQGEPHAPLQQRAHALHEALPAAGHDLRPLERHREGHGEEALVVEAVGAAGSWDDRACGVEVRLQLLRKVQLQRGEGQAKRITVEDCVNPKQRRAYLSE